MSLRKKDIIKNISSKALISSEKSSLLLELFLNHVRSKSKSSTVKISGFGSFFYKRTPSRLGRNPKTKKEILISAQAYLINFYNNLGFVQKGEQYLEDDIPHIKMLKC